MEAPYGSDGEVLLLLRQTGSPYDLSSYFNVLGTLGSFLNLAGKYGDRGDHDEIVVLSLQMSSPLEVTFAWTSAGGGLLLMSLLVYARDFQGRRRENLARAELMEAVASREMLAAEAEAENVRARRAIVDGVVAYVGNAVAEALQTHEAEALERMLGAIQALPVLEVTTRPGQLPPDAGSPTTST